jgi:hypothetical protein
MAKERPQFYRRPAQGIDVGKPPHSRTRSTYPLPTQGIDTHVVQATLLKFGVSFTGAHQFVNGLPVTGQDDRTALLQTAQHLGQTSTQMPALDGSSRDAAKLTIKIPNEIRVSPQPLQSSLLKSGVSSAGTHQFLTGLPVASQADRAILVGLLQRLLQSGGSVARKDKWYSLVDKYVPTDKYT